VRRALIVVVASLGAAALLATTSAATSAQADTSTACPAQGMVSSHTGIQLIGSTATVTFTIAEGCDAVEISLVSYQAPSATFDEQTASQQKLFAKDTGTFSAGEHTLTVALPNCYYQTDFVYGAPIDQLGPAGTNNFYSSQFRLIQELNGGEQSCETTTTPPVVTQTPPAQTQTPVVQTTPTITQPQAPPSATVAPTKTVHKTAKKAVKAVKAKKHVFKPPVKVHKKAKPAKAVVSGAHFTG
jgi:hypothetical protein